MLQLCNFLFSPKIPCNPPHNTTPLWNQFLTIHCRFFTKFFLPLVWMTGCMPWHCHISWLPKRNNKSSDNDSRTAEFYKNVYQKTYLPNDFRLRILGNNKVLEKSQIRWRQMLVPSLLSRNKFLVKAVKNYTEADF